VDISGDISEIDFAYMQNLLLGVAPAWAGAFSVCYLATVTGVSLQTRSADNHYRLWATQKNWLILGVQTPCRNPESGFSWAWGNSRGRSVTALPIAAQ
jgi:hypothetical protein